VRRGDGESATLPAAFASGAGGRQGALRPDTAGRQLATVPRAATYRCPACGTSGGGRFMRILVYSDTNASTIRNSLGAPEYSYYFVLKEFLPALRELGEVVVVSDPGVEVDPLYRESRERGQACVFLSFSPPHKTQANLECPT